MPIVSINLSPKAYAIYDYLSKKRSASRIVSQLLINWDQDSKPILQQGDRRVMSNGDIAEWNGQFFAVVEE
jgi:hypothetical protein